MGRATAEGWAAAVDDGLVTLEAAVSAHFASNCWPAVNQVLVTPACLALRLVKNGHGDEKILLGPQEKGMLVPAAEMVERLHLEAFLECDLAPPDMRPVGSDAVH